MVHIQVSLLLRRAYSSHMTKPKAQRRQKAVTAVMVLPSPDQESPQTGDPPLGRAPPHCTQAACAQEPPGQV